MEESLVLIIALVILYVLGSVGILVCIWWTHKYK